MKVAQNDETNPDTQPVRPPRVLSIVNLQHFTSGSSVRKCETPGILSRMFPPFAGITSYCVRVHPTPLLFFPLFSSVDYETDVATAQFDYGVDDPSFLPEQPGKPPLDHQISPILLYTACIRLV